MRKAKKTAPTTKSQDAEFERLYRTIPASYKVQQTPEQPPAKGKLGLKGKGRGKGNNLKHHGGVVVISPENTNEEDEEPMELLEKETEEPPFEVPVKPATPRKKNTVNDDVKMSTILKYAKGLGLKHIVINL